MTLHSLFPSTNGPATATAFTGNYIAGLLMRVLQGGCWLNGYRWWVCPSGGLTAPQKCATWSFGFPADSGTVIPASVITSGELVAGWNDILLPEPVPIAPYSTYIPCTAVNGAFPDTASQFGTGDPFSGGITAGPLQAFSDQSGTVPEPYGLPQGCFSDFAGGDPSTQLPAQGNSSSNLWMDVLVSDTPPPGYKGSYQLWPNKFDAETYAQAGTDAADNFTLSTEVHYSEAVTTSWVWFFSPDPAGSLPSWCGVWSISGQSVVAANTSPMWLTPDGSEAAVAGGGRCKAALTTVLPPGKYKAAVFNSDGVSGGGWSPYNYGYWLNAGRGGANGITNGPVYAPAQGNATPALIFDGGGSSEPSQGTFSNSATLHYPDTAVDYNVSGPTGAIAESFWVDLEVTPVVASGLPYDYHHREYRR